MRIFERDCRILGRLHRRRLTGKRYAEVYPARNASEVVERLSRFSSDWIFRGQKDKRWGLKPSIERCAAPGFWNAQESRAYQAFRDRAPAYVRGAKCPDSNLAWLAFMQHFGGPTRLLDWTQDSDVAVLFAVADADRKTTSAVWAMHYSAILQESERLLSLDSGNVDDDNKFLTTFFRATWPPVVMCVNTCQPCDRQKEQKGLFLCSNATHSEYDFETCLKNVLQHCPQAQPRWLCKITIPPEARDELLTDLTKRGVTYERLFPDLGGLGRSLGIIESIRSNYFADYYPEIRSE